MMDIVTHHGFWIVLGVILMIGEAAIPAVFVFFGLSAWVVAALVAAGIITGLAPQLLSFAVIGVILLITLRRSCKRWMVGESSKAEGVEDDTGVIGKIATAAKDFERFGSVNLNGSRWMAKSSAAHKKGDSVIVTGNEGNMLLVETYTP